MKRVSSKGSAVHKQEWGEVRHFVITNMPFYLSLWFDDVQGDKHLSPRIPGEGRRGPDFHQTSAAFYQSAEF